MQNLAAHLNSMGLHIQIPLAQGRIEEMHRGFQAQQGLDLDSAMYILGVVAASFLVFIVVYNLWQWRQHRICNDQEKLFREICQAHGLSHRQRKLIHALAKKRQLIDPCAVLLDSRLWVLNPGQDPELCKPRVRKHLLIAHRVLFMEDENTEQVCA